MWFSLGLSVVAAVPLALLAPAVGDPAKDQRKASKVAAKSIYDFSVKDIDGKDVSLLKYKGDVMLIVNVASK